MLKIRLQRVGKKGEPRFRVVLTPHQSSTKSGKFIEVLGWRDPRAHTHALKKERILYWISKGAKPSDTMHNLLVKEGIISGVKVDVSAKSKKKKEGDSEDTKKTAVGEKKDKAPEQKDAEEVKKDTEPKNDAPKEKTEENEPIEDKKKDGKPSEDTEKKDEKKSEEVKPEEKPTVKEKVKTDIGEKSDDAPKEKKEDSKKGNDKKE